LYCVACSAAVSGASAANDKITKSSAISSTNRAYAALVNGRNSTAIQSYSLAIESRQLPTEKLGRSLLNRALAYQNSGKFQHAIDDYTAAMRLDALSPRMRAVALYNRGLAYEKSGNAAMAIEDFTGALLLDPQFAQSYYSRANVLRSHGQYLLAIADYKKARRFNHSKPYLTLFGEALTYDALKQTTRAKALLLKALVVKPDFKAARAKLADMGSTFPALTLVAKTPRETVRVAALSTGLATDTLITNSISPSRADLTLRKTSLPAPVGVPKSITAAPQTIVPLPPVPDVTNLIPTKKTAKAEKPVKVIAKAPEKIVDQTAGPVLSGWTVQLSSQRNSDAAWDVWKNLSARYATLLRGQQATVVKADLGTRGVFYRLRVHQIDSKKQAARLCNKLKRKGTGCFVSKA